MKLLGWMEEHWCLQSMDVRCVCYLYDLIHCLELNGLLSTASTEDEVVGVGMEALVPVYEANATVHGVHSSSLQYLLASVEH